MRPLVPILGQLMLKRLVEGVRTVQHPASIHLFDSGGHPGWGPAMPHIGYFDLLLVVSHGGPVGNLLAGLEPLALSEIQGYELVVGLVRTGHTEEHRGLFFLDDVALVDLVIELSGRADQHLPLGGIFVLNT